MGKEDSPRFMSLTWCRVTGTCGDPGPSHRLPFTPCGSWRHAQGNFEVRRVLAWEETVAKWVSLAKLNLLWCVAGVQRGLQEQGCSFESKERAIQW